MKSFISRICTVMALVFSASCTTTQEIKRSDGSVEFLVACGAGTGWNICYNKANELCPAGYDTLSKDAGFNRKELRISCPNQEKSSD